MAVSVIEVINTEDFITERKVTSYVVEVFREEAEVHETSRYARVTDVVKPGGTVANVGAGPELPSNPYEGQIWILT